MKSLFAFILSLSIVGLPCFANNKTPADASKEEAVETEFLKRHCELQKKAHKEEEEAASKRGMTIEQFREWREKEAEENDAESRGMTVAQYREWQNKERAEIKRKEQALRDGTLSAATPLKSWTADISGTNDVHVMVCTDAADTVGLGGVDTLAFREFVFSADGRLKSISSVKELKDVAR